MQFPDDTPRRGGDNLLPMINVVFLLLIFFLISAEMTPPEPFEVSSPEAHLTEEANGSFILYSDAQGRLAFNGVEDAASGGEQGGDAQGDVATPAASDAIAALISARDEYCEAADCKAMPPELLLRADAALPVPDLARLVGRLAAAGFRDVGLVTQMPAEGEADTSAQPLEQAPAAAQEAK